MARVADVYAALPSITGKLELEYEGELRGADAVARELIRAATGRVFDRHFAGVDLQAVTEWFEKGGEIRMPATANAKDVLAQLKKVPNLLKHVALLNVGEAAPSGQVVSAGEFILEGLWAHRRISRNEERGYHGEAPKTAEPREFQPRGRSTRREFN